jgi:hypothetical protein
MDSDSIGGCAGRRVTVLPNLLPNRRDAFPSVIDCRDRREAKVELTEVGNAIQQAKKEIQQR